MDAAYATTDNMDLVARYAYLDVYDVNDDDTGTESNIYLGQRAAQTALTTPLGGFQAASWMAPLD